MNGHIGGRDLQLANGDNFEVERNSTDGGTSENHEPHPWLVGSNQKWHFDNVRDLVEPTPAQVMNDDFDRVHDHDLGHDR